jgi:hypothetical protein
LIDQTAPGRHQRGQFPGLGRIQHQRGELLAVRAQQREDHDRIRAIILRPGRREGGAEACAGGRMHRVDRQPRILQQGVQQRVAASLDSQRHGLALVGPAQLLQPGVQGFRGGFNRSLLDTVFATDLPGERMGLVSPIQGHEGRIGFVFHGVFWVWRNRTAGRIVRGVGDAGS